MAEVAFHFNAPDKLGYACRLLRKIANSQSRAVVLLAENEIATLDAQLWTFAPLEFVAHCRANAPAHVLAHSPVVLTDRLDAALPHQEVLVNLSPKWPQGFDAFARVIEVVTVDESDRQSARQRWKRYSEMGLNLIRHDLNLRESTAG